MQQLFLMSIHLGPLFRAENSHTSRHLAEFWMIEPEMAFADLDTVANLAEEYLKALIQDLLKHCASDLKFFDEFIEKGLIERLSHVYQTPFTRLTYYASYCYFRKIRRKF